MLGILVSAQMFVFLASLPGFGIETRTTSQYAAWAGPIFLVLTILVFVLGVAMLAYYRSKPWTSARLGLGQAVAAIATNLLDFSHVGGPAPPLGPFVLGVIALILAVGAIACVVRVPRTNRVMVTSPSAPASEPR